jgi:hypothetical protein
MAIMDYFEGKFPPDLDFTQSRESRIFISPRKRGFSDEALEGWIILNNFT